MSAFERRSRRRCHSTSLVARATMTANGSSHSGVLRQFDARQADDARAKTEVVRPNFRCVEIADWCYWNKRALRGVTRPRARRREVDGDRRRCRRVRARSSAVEFRAARSRRTRLRRARIFRFAKTTPRATGATARARTRRVRAPWTDESCPVVVRAQWRLGDGTHGERGEFRSSRGRDVEKSTRRSRGFERVTTHRARRY